jgi:hypothetical protein
VRLAVVVFVLALAGVASADEKHWTDGVSEEKQKAAFEKFTAGNELFVKDEWKAALALYLEALALWDHPNIRYNAAVCLIKTDDLVDAYTHMKAALRFGMGPLTKELHDQGQTYMKMLAASVAHLEVRCDHPGARVTLDGKVLFDTCPTVAEEHLVAAGKHQLVSEKPGYRTETREIVAPGGGRETIVIVMELEGSRTLTRRWPRWLPWVVIAGGGAVGLASVPLWFAADRKLEQYDNDVADTCRPKNGCPAGDPDLIPHEATRSAGRRYNALAISATAVGAAAIATGVVLVVMNQPRLGGLTVTPEVGPDRAGASLTLRW